MARNASFFRDLLDTILDRRSGPWGGRRTPDGDLKALAGELLSRRGELSGVAMAQEIVERFDRLGEEGRVELFEFLASGLAADPAAVAKAAQDYLAQSDQQRLDALGRAVEPPRQEFFRRLNLAPGGTAAMVRMRAKLLTLLPEHPHLKPVEEDLAHLFQSWFNRGFLVLRRIDWSSPAAILEKIIAYEAVHEIEGWDDLKRRLDPRDRRCFAFFHPSLADEPLIFVEVALVAETPSSIRSLLAGEPAGETSPPSTAVFYSISNCQSGLAGISFGNFLIKQVVNDLAAEDPQLQTFVTLSPMPGFLHWLERAAASEPALEDGLRLLDEPDWPEDDIRQARMAERLKPLAARYLLREKRSNGQPVDAVARFHLGNGARVERINWLADRSARGFRESAGLMVNYLYELKTIERNHEDYAERGAVAASPTVRRLLKQASIQASLAGF